MCVEPGQTGHALEMSGDASAMNTTKWTKSELPIEEMSNAVGLNGREQLDWNVHDVLAY